jgi:putative ABC transport system substrate-binding protein
MRRREFISLIGSATAWPLAARAEPSKLSTIGFLGASTPSAWSRFVPAFVQRLRDLGWIEGRNVAIEFRWAEGRTERYTEIATEFVRLKVDVIVTTGGAVLAVKQVTSVIPIVFALALDPVGSGMVTSLARPGGNITGLSLQSTDLSSKRLELLREIVPGLHRLAILGNAGYPAAVEEMSEVQATARSLGFVEVAQPEIRRAADIAPALEALKGHAEALYLSPDPLVFTHRIQISNLALGAGLAVISFAREYVEVGALLSYGPNYVELFRSAAEYVDKILRGTKPGDLPVQQPTRFELVINLKTAKALGLTVPPSLLARADEIIE